MTKEISYIHFSDLHIGQKWSNQYLPNAKDIILDDLRHVIGLLKGLDIVFFTGDMVQSGTSSEYDDFMEWFGDIKDSISKLGYDPYYLFVPGNHDLQRISDESDPTHKMLKLSWLIDSELRENYLWDKNKAYYKYLVERFENYHKFLQTFYMKNKRPEVVKEGLIPGDFYVELNINMAKVGVVGLNSAFLQIDGDEFQKKLGIYHRQIHEIFGREDYVKTLKECDLTLLLTHHEPEWYEPKSYEDYTTNIMSAGKFCEHLCGHRHEPKSQSVKYNYGSERNLSLAPSLFGVEFKNLNYERIHGYHAGKYKIEDDGSINKLFYPRRATKMEDGFELNRDPYYKYDEKDGCFRTVSLKVVGKDNFQQINATSANEDVLGKAKTISDSLVRPSTIKSSYVYDGVRLIEQEKALSMLDKAHILWVYSHFGLGEEEFVSSVLSKKSKDNNALFVLNCEGANTFEEFEHAVKEQYSRPFASLINNLSENYIDPVLILKNVESVFVKKESAALKTVLTSVLNFNKRIRVVIVSYTKPLDAYFQSIELKPLDLEDVKHCLEASNCNANYRAVDVERIHALTNGYPIFLDIAFSELEFVDIEELDESDFSIGDADFGIPSTTQEYIMMLKNSSSDSERRSYSLLRLLSFLPKGETFKSIVRFDTTKPFLPASLPILKSRDLVGTDYYYTFEEGKFVVMSSLIRVPQAYRNYVISLSDEEERRSLYSDICTMYFGRDWLLKNDVNIYAAHKGEYCSFAFHNASVALKQLLSYSIRNQKWNEVVRYLRIAGQFVQQLSEQSFFYVANIISDELFSLEKDILCDEAKAPLAYLKYLVADIKRMNDDYDGAERMFLELIDERILNHDKILSCMECLAYIYNKLGKNDKAIEMADKMLSECKKRDETHKCVAEYIKAKNKSYDDDEKRLSELNRVYCKVNKLENRTITINVVLEMAWYDHSKKMLKKIEKLLQYPNIISYDRMRLLSMKYQIMTSPELDEPLTETDINNVRAVYTYSFMQMLTQMMQRSHAILWEHYAKKMDFPMLINLMKYSCFVWEMQSKSEIIQKYVAKIRNFPEFMSWIKNNLDNDDVSVLVNERGLG